MQSKVFSSTDPGYIEVGTVVKAQGLRGEVKIQTLSQQPENFAHYPKLTLVSKERRTPTDFTVLGQRIQGDCVIVTLAGISDRNQAESLVGCRVLLERSLLPPIGEDEFYWHQLEGLAVVTVDGVQLGKIESIFSNGAQDILVVRQGQREYLIPLTRPIVQGQNEGELVIDPPPGLLEINSGPETGGDMFAE